MDWTLNLTELIEKLPRYHKNRRTLTALEGLIRSLDKIPIEEIEKLVQKYE